jgi:hypothetical protein
MPEFSESKIYAIRSHKTDKYYIGSTTRTLGRRFSAHKYDYNKRLNGGAIKYSCRSSEILKYDDAYIELIEEFPCQSEEELRKREGELIRQYQDQIVNKARPARTAEEAKQYMKDWKAAHPNYRQEWLAKHPDYMKKWREAHPNYKAELAARKTAAATKVDTL